MAKVTPGYKLYLYQLLAREVGYGQQTLLPQVEEVLRNDDILCEDLECDSIQELAEACPEFIKLTAFKKGRVFATVLHNEQWDAMLAAPTEKPAADKGSKAGGMKSWKKNKKKGAQKAFKPVKPGKKRRDREAAEAEARRAAEEAAAAAEAAAEAMSKAAAVALETVTDTVSATMAAAVAGAESVAEIVSETIASIAADEPPAAAPEDAASNAAESEPTDAVDDTDAAKRGAAEEEPAEAEEPSPEEGPRDEGEPASDAAPKPAPTSGGGISLTITYDPYEDMERELERQRSERPEAMPAATETPSTPEPEPAAQPVAAQPAPATSPFVPTAPTPSGLPLSFAQDVSCKDALLRALYQLLPYEADPMSILDEDWRVARSTSGLTGSRSRVTFPLRYQHEDGTPITVTLRRTTRNASGRQWSLALVDGDDGSGSSHDAFGFDSMPTVDEGAWSDLPSGSNGLELSPARELAQQVAIGSWDAFLGALAVMAAPERWSYPGEQPGEKGRYGILRDYICSTFHRLHCQQRISVSADGSFSAFATGLMTALGDDIYACMSARKGDIPWQFEGFATVESGELGARLTGSLSPLPEQATYLTSLESATLDPHRMIVIDYDTLLTKQLGRLPRAFLREHLELCDGARETLAQEGTLSSEELAQLARIVRDDASATRRLRRAIDDAVEQTVRDTRASYRLAVPVYDPAENRTKLLLPLCLVSMGEADCALVLDLQPSGTYRAASILSLPRAYACARTISREQPSWLSIDHALG